MLADFSEAMGHAGAIVRHPNGLLEGATDPRSNGAPPGTKEQTMTTQPDWSEYLTQMTHLLDMELDAPRREELERQFARIAAMAQPLMDYPLGPREEIAGVYKA